MKMQLCPDTLARLCHREFIQLFAVNYRSPLFVREFIARYDTAIRQTVAVALRGGESYLPQRLQPTPDETVNEIYCLLFRQNCRALRCFQGRHENAIFAYLHTVCLNYVRNQRRDEARKQGFIRPASYAQPEERATGFSSGEAEWRLLEDRIRVELRRAFRSGNACRNFIIFKLRFLYGYQYHEIARIKALGLSRGGVGNAASRLRVWLHREFAGGGLA
jgi:DNA-directed RNA polymerase specialized sigma24 family protein